MDITKRELSKKWGKVPANLVVKIANECSKGIDWVGSPKGSILNAYICSVAWNQGKIIKEQCSIVYGFDPTRLPFNPCKFEWLMDRAQLMVENVFKCLQEDMRFERQSKNRWLESWTKSTQNKEAIHNEKDTCPGRRTDPSN